MGKKSVAEIDEENQAEEQHPLKPEEKEFYEAGLNSLTPDQRRRMLEVSPFDPLQIVRGYQTYDPRKEETIKAFQMIQNWRDSVNFEHIFDKPHKRARAFHTEMWDERVYGRDKHGHFVIGFQFQSIDVNRICDLSDDDLSRIVGQKLAAYTHMKARTGKETGVQRYKSIFIIDMAGAGGGILNGKRRNTIKKVMDYGSNYFPESVWKIYVINTPWAIRAGWSGVSMFIHPVTQAKINICGDPTAALTKLQQNDGCTLDDLPESVGGNHKGKNVYKLIQETVAEKKAAKAAPRPGAAAAGGAARKTPPGTLL